MREIKFRAWNKAQKRWANHIELLDVVPVSANILIPCAITIGKEDSEWEFVQFTGLKDKNGKEIYERDIVKQIYYPPSGSLEESLYDVRFDHGGFSNAGAEDDDIEVIGNIYENPELLKV